MLTKLYIVRYSIRRVYIDYVECILDTLNFAAEIDPYLRVRIQNMFASAHADFCALRHRFLFKSETPTKG